jgi:hypothetical protein
MLSILEAYPCSPGRTGAASRARFCALRRAKFARSAVALRAAFAALPGDAEVDAGDDADGGEGGGFPVIASS